MKDPQKWLIKNIGLGAFGHFISGAFFSLSALYLFNSLLFSFISAFLLGVSKELFDKYYRNTAFTTKDVFHTTAGFVLTLIIYLIGLF